MANTIAIRIKKTVQGGPRGSDPKTNPWLVAYNRNNQGWQPLGRFPTEAVARGRAKQLANKAEEKGFKVAGRFRG